MDMTRALELLQAPQKIKFNLVAFNNWKNADDRKIKLLETLEWVNAELRQHNTLLKMELSKQKFALIATERAKRHMAEAAKNLPFDDKGKLPKQAIIELGTEYYAAGYYEAISRAVEEPQETKRLREQGEALRIIEAEATRIREYIETNKIVDAKGNVMEY